MALFAPIKATDLMNLEGLASGELFAWNVRMSLGKTKVNKEIAKSIKAPTEHRNFLLYHNGLTILCREMEQEADQLRISGYTVVNGAQSLTSLYENRHEITNDIRLLARFVRLDPESELAAKITRHSNNQNAISARDLQSNSSLQRRLQNEFVTNYPGKVFYRIKRGEESDLPLIIDNEEAARILLAFDLQQPWTCHQSYKLFDELHAEIFARPTVTAHRILAFYIVYQSILDSLDKIENHLFGHYRLTQFLLLYLGRQILELDEVGKEFVRYPQRFVCKECDRQRLRSCMDVIFSDLVVDLNAEIKEMGEHGEPFDYKRELKSSNPVKSLAKQIVPLYKKAVTRGRASAFGTEWDDGKDSSKKL
jgi:hypothetical protein